MANLSAEEKPFVDEIRQSLQRIKKEGADIEKATGKLAKINYDAGRMKEGNASLRLRAQIGRAISDVVLAHMDASDALIDGFDDGNDIVAFGAGGR